MAALGRCSDEQVRLTRQSTTHQSGRRKVVKETGTWFCLTAEKSRRLTAPPPPALFYLARGIHAISLGAGAVDEVK